MAQYLNFNADNCKNCYKCLRDCPVKAIAVRDDKARIEDELCILCGHCANVCRFNAKEVVSGVPKVRQLLKGSKPVIASIAPAFAASYDSLSFDAVRNTLINFGFSDASETAVGAKVVTAEYRKLLDERKHKNLIASACPSIVRLIQIYYPTALKYLAEVDSPMVAHAKIIREQNPNAAVVFIGPCIAKKREAEESGIIDAVLTFEELNELILDFEQSIRMAEEKSRTDDKPQCDALPDFKELANRARYYPINRGIIKSFDKFTDGYEYISIDGVSRAQEVLSNIDVLSGMFIEMHACEFSCINGPCALNKDQGGYIKATETIRTYAKTGDKTVSQAEQYKSDFSQIYPQLKDVRIEPPEYEIKAILEATGKFKTEDELDCGACGYPTCRDKAKAVYNGRAHIDMCVPYMREKAESMSYDIIRNSPNGILAVDEKLTITELNLKAQKILGIPHTAKGDNLDKYLNPTDFYLALLEDKKFDRKRVYIDKTNKWVESSIRKVSGQNMVFCIMTDITADIETSGKLVKIKEETARAADEVIGKQMRVVQEIASLLGETAAETKIALIKLKNTLKQEQEQDGE